MSTNKPQPKPRRGKAKPTWALVVADMRERDSMGAKKYGVRHQHDNGRDHLVDSYQEVLDLACYLRAEIEKRKRLKAITESMMVPLVTPPREWFRLKPAKTQLSRITWRKINRGVAR